MMNWLEIEVEKEIAQERYSMITDPGIKVLKSTDASPPQVRRALAWTGRRLSGLGCILQALAGEACA